MKKQTAFTFAFLVIILISAIIYGNFSNNKKENKEVIKPNNQKTILKKEVVPSIPQITPQEERKELEKNVWVINDVWNTWNIDDCKNISDTNLQQKCEDNANLAKASIDNSKANCIKVKDETLRKRCLDNYYTNESKEKNSISFCDKINDNFNKNKCKTDIIFPKIEDISFSWSIDICNSLSQKDKEYCENKINFINDTKNYTIWIETKNNNWCSLIKNISLQKKCNSKVQSLIAFDKAIKSNDIENCKTILDTTKKSECEKTLKKVSDDTKIQQSINTNNLSWCDIITDTNAKNKCFDLM